MQKTRFIIVGSGWRALYYVRAAKALPQQLSLCALLCRTPEKAARLAAAHGIHTTTSVRECVDLRPDFVVVAVNKDAIASVSMEWLARGIPVLCETPAALDAETLGRLWAMHEAGHRLAVAEQYTAMPVTAAMLTALKDGRLGAPQFLSLSMAHEYHGASLMRAFLALPTDMPFTVSAHSFRYPTAETLNRYRAFTDGSISEKTRTTALFRFADGRAALYDFDSEQYRSPIRRSLVKLQGVRGELLNHSLAWLDADNRPCEQELTVETRTLVTDDPNPNLHTVTEVTAVRLGDATLYTPPFGPCGLAQDETAIAVLLRDMGAYARGEGGEPYPLADALQDAYTAILLRRAIETGQPCTSEPQPWNR